MARRNDMPRKAFPPVTIFVMQTRHTFLTRIVIPTTRMLTQSVSEAVIRTTGQLGEFAAWLAGPSFLNRRSLRRISAAPKKIRDAR
jgi:hypothetical protein